MQSYETFTDDTTTCSRNEKTLPTKTVYYENELEDEFSSKKITPKVIDEKYDYLGGPLFKVIRAVLYRGIATPLATLYCKATLAHKVIGKEKLKSVEKDDGYFLYGNHTQETADAFIPSLVSFPRSVYVIVHPNNVSMPVLGKLTPYLGALPIPSNLKAMRSFKNAIDKRLIEGAVITVYPEAHIWPFYTGIRPFPSTSFKYPVEFNAPSFAMTTTYQKRKRGIKPQAITYIDGPFYPDMNVCPKDRAEKLRNEIYEAMVERSKLSNCEYIRYERRRG